MPEAIIVPHQKYEVGTLTIDEWAVTFGTVRRGLDGAQARQGPSSLYQMYHSPPINGQCTNHHIAV